MSLSRFSRITLAATLLACAFSIQAQPAAAVTGSGSDSTEQWRNFAAGSVTAPAANAASAVFMRDATDVGPAVNVYVNGEYAASLLPGGWQQTAVCAGINQLTAEVTDGSGRYSAKEVAGTGQAGYNAPAGQVSYFKVTHAGRGAYNLAAVDAATAQRALAGMQRQANTLSRVDRLTGCPQARAQQVAPQMFRLQAGALFAFDKADYQHLLPAGKQEIAQVAEQIKRGAKVDRIDVVGHTDPEGSAAYNHRLSMQRAQTVKRALVENGLPADRITAMGRGKDEPLKANCRAQFPKRGAALNDCNQVNRRVEITFHGVR